MITLKEFKRRRSPKAMKNNSAEISFSQLFKQWVSLDGKLSYGETCAYTNEVREYRKIIGLTKANEIMDEILDDNILNIKEEQ